MYAKPPFGGPEQVLKYLARYTHRVAISNRRLVALEDGEVTFHWKDYAHGGGQKTMTLKATEFIRRFLLHVLPSGFVRIRHYGFLANRVCQEKLALCRALLGDRRMEISLKPSYPVLPNDARSLVGHRLASGRATVMEDSVEQYDALIRSGARRLTGYQRRLFQAEVATALCGGNARQAERRFGWGRETVEKGLHEQQHGDALPGELRRARPAAQRSRRTRNWRPTSAPSSSPIPTPIRN